MADLWAAIFVVGIKAKVHRHPFRKQEGVPITSNPKITQVDFPDNESTNGLNCYSEIDEQPHPTFVAVHRALTERFPCICDLPDDLVDDGVWSDGPLINNFGQQQAVIGFMYSTVESVLPFVVKIAHKHGINAFDWQTESIYRPNS